MDDVNQVTETAPENIAPEIEKKTKKNKTPIIIAVVIALVLIIGGALTSYFLYFEPLGRYEDAVKQMNSRQYDDAKEMFAELGDFKDSAEMIKECDYKEAKKFIEKGNYASARENLQALGDYKDCTELLSECTYLEATKHFEEENYSKANELFASIPDYKDSAELASECIYLEANELLSEKEYVKASKLFAEIPDYEDSAELYAKCNYNAAESHLKNNEYKEAITFYEATGDYKDSYEKLYSTKLKYSTYFTENSNFKEAYDVLESVNSIPGYDTSSYVTDIDGIQQLVKELNYIKLRAVYLAAKDYTQKDLLDVLVMHRKTAAESGEDYKSAISALYAGGAYKNVFTATVSQTVKKAADGTKKFISEDKDMVINKVSSSLDDYSELHVLLAAAYPDFEAYTNYIFTANFDSPEVFEKKAEELRQKCLVHLEKIEAELATIEVPA